MAGAAGLYCLVPWVPLALAGAGALATQAFMWPELPLLLIVASIPFYLVPKSAPGLPFSLTEFLVVVGGGAAAVRELLRMGRGGRANFGPLLSALYRELPILLFLAAGIVGVLVAEVKGPALRELRVVVAEPVLIYYLIVALGKERRQVWWLVGAWLLGAAALAAHGLYQYAFTEEVIDVEGVRRITSVYNSPNNLGLLLGRAAPLAAALAFLGSQRRWTYGLALGLILAALTLTYSVGAWVGVAAAGLFLAFLARGRRALPWVLGAAMLVGLALLPLAQAERIASRLDFQEGTVALRLYTWQAAANMLRDHPFFGVGLDNFYYQYPRYMLPEAWQEPNLSHPHNLFLDFWLRMGLPGLLVTLWLIYRFFLAGLRLYGASGRQWGLGPPERALVAGLMASMVDFLVHGMVDNSYFLVDLALIFWLTMALMRVMEKGQPLGLGLPSATDGGKPSLASRPS